MLGRDGGDLGRIEAKDSVGNPLDHPRNVIRNCTLHDRFYAHIEGPFAEIFPLIPFLSPLATFLEGIIPFSTVDNTTLLFWKTGIRCPIINPSAGPSTLTWPPFCL